jgi:hypothetical protein
VAFEILEKKRKEKKILYPKLIISGARAAPEMVRTSGKMIAPIRPV